jgi:long-chain acyl-CoA synthetase
MNTCWNVERAALFFPDKPAIIFEDRKISYRQLNASANQLANAMLAKGIQKGDRVALYLPNIPEFAIVYIAAQKIGAIAVSVNSMLKTDELKFILNDSGTSALFTVEELLPNIDLQLYPSLKHVIVCEGKGNGYALLSDWMAPGNDTFRTLNMAPDDPASLLYTSGTTGFPKGATLTHRNVVSNMWTTAHHSGFRPDDRLALFLPLFHVFGQDFIMNGAFTACATLVLFRRFVPDLVLKTVEQEGITMFFSVPTIYISLLNMDLSPFNLSTIRYDFSAAATMPKEISIQWTDRFHRRVYEGYGLTECSPFACYNHDFQHKFGSIGTPVENTEVRILNEDDQEVEPGQWGEICIRGPGVMKGYWNRPVESEKALRSGWLHTGDTGLVDDQGYVYIVDRVKDMINVSGFKVWPAEVEQHLYKHSDIKELAVYGVPHPVKGEIVRAAIVLKPDAVATEDDIKDFCRKNLANYKIPETIEFVDELPKSPTGKLLKRVLRDQSTIK